MLGWVQDLAALCLQQPGLQVGADLAGAGSMGMFWSHSLQGLFGRYRRPTVALSQNSGWKDVTELAAPGAEENKDVSPLPFPHHLSHISEIQVCGYCVNRPEIFLLG